MNRTIFSNKPPTSLEVMALLFQFKSIFQSIEKIFQVTLHEKCPNEEFFWSIFSYIWTEYGDLLQKFPYSVRLQENTDAFYAVLVLKANQLNENQLPQVFLKFYMNQFSNQLLLFLHFAGL